MLLLFFFYRDRLLLWYIKVKFTDKSKSEVKFLLVLKILKFQYKGGFLKFFINIELRVESVISRMPFPFMSGDKILPKNPNRIFKFCINVKKCVLIRQ